MNRIIFLEEAAKYIALSSIVLYLPFYHIAKVLLEASILVTIPLFLYSLAKNYKELKVPLLWFFLAMLYPLVYFISYKVHGYTLDWKYFHESLRAIIPAAFLYLCLMKAKTKITGAEVVLALALSLYACSAMALYDWLYEDKDRVSLGTNLILVFSITSACAASLLFSLVFVRTKGQRWTWVLLASIPAVGAGYFTILTTSSRGPLLALTISFLAGLLLIRTSKIIKLSSSIILLILIALGSLYHPINNRLQNAVTEIQDYFQQDTVVEGSISIRLQMLEASINEIKTDPVEIRGSQPLADMFLEQITAGEVMPQIGKFAHTHNDFLQTWLSRGVLGILTFVLVLLLPVLMTKHNSYTNKAAIMLTLTAFVGSLTNSNFSSAFFLKFYFLMTFLLPVTAITLSTPHTNKEPSLELG